MESETTEKTHSVKLTHISHTFSLALNIWSPTKCDYIACHRFIYIVRK